MPFSDNPYSTGDIGENYVKYKLSQIGIDAVNIDRVYDLFLWRNMHRIEVKTSNAHVSGKHIIPQYGFTFKHGQTERDAFDYAVCIGLGDDNKVQDMYIIPQDYIHKRAVIYKKTSYCSNITILKENLSMEYKNNTYDKYDMCKLSLDIFKEDHKATFTRKKRELTKKLLTYEARIHKKMVTKFKSIYNDKSIKNPVQVAKEKLGISSTTAWLLRKKLNIRNHIMTDAELEKEYLRLWEEGYYNKEIVKKLRTSQDRVGPLRKRLGLPRVNPYNKRGKTKKQKEAMKNASKTLTANRLIRDKENKGKISKLWRKGHTRMEIEKILGISSGVVTRLTKDMTLPRSNPYRRRR